ncbi:1-aminocyclopropane-1-carboxylate oxidase 2 isoform X2 [Gastrolobium bilobum]|uniref:1-aminocyclopropane-1-carboxylate oxidase 2 isoform X2 n=1 Tax=Gastrolobium bilobum TaxID=150636 RepID=UPI002AAFF4F7|nr:1-aminocyclopropane-1-carboxylate oxidase 2 isoform X2 [Gastrolobium bilobum]
MASSAHKQHQLIPNLYGGATSAPPPTPSTHPNNLLSTSDAADALSRLLHRLPPNLSLPTRRSSSSAAATCPPSLSLSSQTPNDILSSVSQLGFAQLTDHSVPSELANSAESEALALFDLSRDQKESFFPMNWPLGYEGDGLAESFRLDSSCSTESSELALASLREFTRALEKLGLNIIDGLTKALGFENPVGNDPTRFWSVMWVSECPSGTRPGMSGGFYPFIVGLQYQIRCQKYSLLSDSGWVSVLPHVDSILVTVGDIAQVWSNGKLKKVRGRAITTVGDENVSRCITMSLLITLPTESRVAPLLGSSNKDQKEEDEEEGEGRVFNTFDFEDYAWRVYHERLHFKDPLDRYRVT